MGGRRALRAAGRRGRVGRLNSGRARTPKSVFGKSTRRGSTPCAKGPTSSISTNYWTKAAGRVPFRQRTPRRVGGAKKKASGEHGWRAAVRPTAQIAVSGSTDKSYIESPRPAGSQLGRVRFRTRRHFHVPRSGAREHNRVRWDATNPKSDSVGFGGKKIQKAPAGLSRDSVEIVHLPALVNHHGGNGARSQPVLPESRLKRRYGSAGNGPPIRVGDLAHGPAPRFSSASRRQWVAAPVGGCTKQLARRAPVSPSIAAKTFRWLKRNSDPRRMSMAHPGRAFQFSTGFGPRTTTTGKNFKRCSSSAREAPPHSTWLKNKARVPTPV